MFVTIQSTELLSLGEAAYEFKAKLTRESRSTNDGELLSALMELKYHRVGEIRILPLVVLLKATGGSHDR